MRIKLVESFFAAADSLDVDVFGKILTDDIVWRFGNFPEVRGKAAVLEQYVDIAQMLQSMRHEIMGVWRSGAVITAETRVFYCDRFGRRFDFPGCDIMFLSGRRFKEVRIFVDNHLMFIPPENVVLPAAKEAL